MLKQILFTTSILIICFQLSAQMSISDRQRTKIDKLFDPWQSESVPGTAMAILHKGQTIYQSSAGMADLASSEEIDANTKFQMSALSQQFVVFGILLLQEEGKINLDADIRSILPEFKKFEHDITVNHVLASTSGLNDFWSLKYLKGWRDGDIINQNDVFQFINNQEELAFKPGTEFELSYTDISVLAMIIEAVTGRTLNEYLNDKVFAPLNMTNTSFTNGDNSHLENLAKPYIKSGDTYERNDMRFKISGPINLFSTINDMSKWYSNFYNKKVGAKSAIKNLNSYAQLDNGATYNQTRGTLTLGRGYAHPERGISKIYQNGWTGSYTISVYNFVTEDMIGFVFSNGGEDYNGHLPMIAISDLLDDKFPLPATTDFTKMNTLRLSSIELEKYCGHYWSDELSLSREIVLVDDTLRYSRGNYSSPLVPIGVDKFQMKMQSDDLIYISFENAGGKRRFKFKTPSSDPSYSEYYNSQEPSTKQLQSYEGAYVNVSNGIIYKVNLSEGELKLLNPENEQSNMNLVFGDKFLVDAWYIDQINFKKNHNGRVNSLVIRGPGIGEMLFQRVNKSEGIVN